MRNINRFRRHIEESDWDDYILEGEGLLKGFCWSIIIIATLYFGSVCFVTLMG